jgi:beta-lactamase regulating signal transducer with metallopeptidase domain
MSLAVIGWVVLNSLWQWTLVAGVTALAASIVRDRHASVRYVVEIAGFVAMLAISAFTLISANQPGAASLQFRMTSATGGAFIVYDLVPWGHTILRLVGLAYTIGAAICIARLAAAWRRARTLRALGLTELPGSLRAEVATLKRELAIARTVDVSGSTRASVPMLLGWRHPLILVPEHAARTLAFDHLRAILAHELGHVRRRDDVANLIQVCADVLVFHHPAARWISRRIRTAREYSCDDIAVAAVMDAKVYARALAAIEDGRDDCRVAVAAASGTLLDRIQRILGARRRMLTVPRGAIVLAVCALVSAAILAALVNVPPPSVPSGVRMRRPG